MMVTFWVAGSTKDISRTKASSEPPKSCGGSSKRETECRDIQTHLDNPYWSLLFATQNALGTDDSRHRIDGAVNGVDADDVGTF